MGIIEDKKGSINLLELVVGDERKYINFNEDFYREITGGNVNNTIFYLPKDSEFFMYYNNKRYHVSRERVQYLKYGMGMESAEALLVSFAMIKDLNNEKDYTLDEVFEFIRGRKTNEIEDFVNNVGYLMKTGFISRYNGVNIQTVNYGDTTYTDCETIDDVIDVCTQNLINEEESKRNKSFSDDYEKIRSVVRGALLGGWTTYIPRGHYDKDSLRVLDIIKDNNIKDGNLSGYFNNLWGVLTNDTVQFQFTSPKAKEFVNKLKGTYLNRGITKTYISNELHKSKRVERYIDVGLRSKHSGETRMRKDVLKGVVDVDIDVLGVGISKRIKDYINDYYTKTTNKTLEGFDINLNNGDSILNIDYKNDEIEYYHVLKPEVGVYEISIKNEKLSEYKFYSQLDKWIKGGNNRGRSIYDEIRENLKRAINFNIIELHREANVEFTDIYHMNVGELLVGNFNFVNRLNKHLIKDFVTEESIKRYIYDIIPYNKARVRMLVSSGIKDDVNTIIKGERLYDIKNAEDKKNSTSPNTENLISIEEVNDFARDILYLSEKLIKYSISQNHKDILSGVLNSQTHLRHNVKFKDEPQFNDRESYTLKRSRLKNANYNAYQIYKMSVRADREKFNEYTQFIEDKLKGNMLDLFKVHGRSITKSMNKEYKNYFNKQFSSYVGYVDISQKFKTNNLREELIRRGLITSIQNHRTSESIVEILTVMDRIEDIRDRDKLDAIEYILGDSKERQCIPLLESLRLYRDYVNMFNELVKHNMRLGSMFKVKPFSLKLEHDIVVTDYNTIKHQIDNKRFTEVYEENSDLGLSGLELEDSEGNNYVVVEPGDVKDLSAEGQELRHCVGSYARRVIEKTSLIYFLRKKGNEDKSFVTIEVGKRGNSYKLLQSRGSSNKDYRNELTKKIETKLKEYNKESEKTG